MPKVAPYGTWESPITAELIASQSIRPEVGLVDGEDIYWTERRPTEGGRVAIVKYTPEGQIYDVIAPPFNARSRVHEYGGGAFTIHQGNLYFTNCADQRIYYVQPGQPPTPLTPEGPLRYADLTGDPVHRRLLCIREAHSDGGEPVNTITAIDTQTGEQQVLASGNDFYATPRLSPKGDQLVWLTWDHPYMPWDSTELWLADVTPQGTLANSRKIAGGPGESIFQPEWSPDGKLHFVSDASGWWNLYRRDGEEITPLYPMAAEFGIPQWVFRMSHYAFIGVNRILCSYTQDGLWYLAELNTATGEFSPIPVPYTAIYDVQTGPGFAIFQGASPTLEKAIIKLDIRSGKSEILKRSSEVEIKNNYISQPEAVSFPTAGNHTAYGFYYPPHNADYAALEDELPPLIVLSHSGPTSATATDLDLQVQYWTSRGFAVLDVNYRGSTGYGRAYREQLNGQWGVVDVEDCINGARYLVEQGWVDGDRLIIRGHSAGGYTTLCALTFHNIFKAGASYAGIADMEAIAQESHKFEAHYMDTLIGPYPEHAGLYRERSPIYHIEGLNCPVIFFQGLQDPVVPPAQAQKMAQVLRDKGIPVQYIAFENEGHSLRSAENLK
ncbi:MAG: S9 family peptidase, partial [Anaerolineae bacterium]|nr:S9 family peptidase [Anaerolineae bacterium]